MVRRDGPVHTGPRRPGGAAQRLVGHLDRADPAVRLDEARLRGAFDPDFVTALAARSPLGSPTVLGVVLRVADTLAAEQGFRRWGFQSVLTDKEVPPTLRRHLPTDRPADPVVRASDTARAATSVAPPGMA